MAATLKLEIVTPTASVLQADSDSITIPGKEGELGILPGHISLITEMGSGLLSYTTEGTKKTIAVHYGFAEMNQGKLTVLTQIAEKADEVDLGRAKDAQKKAEQILTKTRGTDEESLDLFKKYEAKLVRSLIRQQASTLK
jgi:F-type H+-transporting ATPase subunit epsilon